MKTELKTLKDMPFDEIEQNCLKSKAIKWVKELNKGIRDKQEEKNVISIEGWIKYFFNLTEEDLK
jgi:hypothetical protein